MGWYVCAAGQYTTIAHICEEHGPLVQIVPLEELRVMISWDINSEILASL